MSYEVKGSGLLLLQSFTSFTINSNNPVNWQFSYNQRPAVTTFFEIGIGPVRARQVAWFERAFDQRVDELEPDSCPM